MRADEFSRSIRQSWAFVYDELGIARTASSLYSLRVNNEFNEVALDNSTTYIEIYLKAASLSYYNLMLDDYAMFQFSWSNETQWRLAYLPNPWISGATVAQDTVADWEALESLGALDQEAVNNLISELPYRGAIPPIRFDYAPHQYSEIAHPAAHLHIGRHTENRWAIIRPLTPLTFTMYLVKLYYSSSWNPRSSFYGNEVEGCLDCRLIDELNRMRVVSQFSQRERRSLHITSM